MSVIRRHNHPDISDEIRRELIHSKSRDTEGEALRDESEDMLMELNL